MPQALFIHAVGDLRLGDAPTETLGTQQVRIAMKRGGICGSDLHYFNHGGFGAITLKEPMVLGHEVSGEITERGADVTDLMIGDLVAVSPSRPCRTCDECLRGLPKHCLNMRFYGPAMPFPHIQGAFRDVLIADARQCVVASGITAAQAAMVEPLAVALHAVTRAGEMMGKRVLVTGCGPIGALVILAARRAGAAEIIATDITGSALDVAKAVGANVTLNTRDAPDALTPYAVGKGTLDVMFECSGAPSALAAGISALRPRGQIVQLGLSGDMSLPMMQITAKELSMKGTFRFHEAFPLAVQMMQQGLIDVSPLLSHSFPVAEFAKAFAMANDRSKAMKVQLVFGQ